MLKFGITAIVAGLIIGAGALINASANPVMVPAMAQPVTQEESYQHKLNVELTERVQTLELKSSALIGIIARLSARVHVLEQKEIEAEPAKK